MLANDLNNEFVDFMNTTEMSMGINVSIYVLQAGAWPLGQTSTAGNFTMPEELAKSVQEYELFYHSKFTGRKLTWLHHICEGW